MRIQAILWTALAAGVPAAVAGSITFTIGTTGSGSLGGTPFNDATVTFTQVTDTTLGGSGGFGTPSSNTNTVMISGLGTVTITVSTAFFCNNSAVGITWIPITDLLDERAPAFASYNLDAALGPISGTVTTLTYWTLPTSGGALTLTGTSSNASFQAVLGSSTVPEPGSLVLMLAGVIPFGTVLRRRRRS